jgi:acetyltransferase-like isoleucine patch superfamily enzyme
MINQNNVKAGRGTLYNSPIKLLPSTDGIEFGNFCAIAPNLKIFGHNHDYNFPAIQYTFYNKYFNQDHPIDSTSTVRTKGKVIIGSDVWIGEDVIILSGVNIGDGVVIGAGSVVSKDLEPYTICVGVPCKSVKKRYREDVINFLLELKWWNWEDDRIKKNKVFFNTNLNKTSLEEIELIIV